MKNPFIQSECACIYKENIYFFSEFNNSLNCLNIVTQEVNALATVPWENIAVSRLYTLMYAVGNNIVLMPFFGKYITIYELNNKKFEKIGPCMQPCQVSASILFDDKIYMIISNGCEKDGIYSLDVNKRELKLEHRFVDICGIGYKRIWTSCISEMSGKLYFCIGETNKFISYEPKEKKVEFYTMPGNLTKCYGLICGGKILFSIDEYSKKGILFSENMEIVGEYMFGENMKYYNLVYDFGIIYIHPFNSEITYEIHIQKDNNYYVEISSVFVKKGTLLKTEYGVTLLPTKDNRKFTFREKKIDIVGAKIPSDDYLKEIIKKKKIMDENIFSLDWYIESIKNIMNNE